MAITPEEIEHLALLCRLGLSDEEKKKLAPDLRRILDYVGELKRIETKDVPPLVGGTDLVNVFRADEKNPPEIEPQELLEQTPRREDRHVKVPRILE